MELIRNADAYRYREDNPALMLRRSKFIIEYPVIISKKAIAKLEEKLIEKRMNGGPGTQVLTYYSGESTFVFVNCGAQPEYKDSTIFAYGRKELSYDFIIRIPNLALWNSIIKGLRLSFAKKLPSVETREIGELDDLAVVETGLAVEKKKVVFVDNNPDRCVINIPYAKTQVIINYDVDI